MRLTGRACVVVLLLVMLTVPSTPAVARQFFVDVMQGVRLKASVDSRAEVVYRGIVRAKWDVSCGAAALATALSCYGESVTEREILEEMLETVTPEQREAGRGFSLLHIKQAAERRGYTSQGFRGVVQDFDDLGYPSIVLLTLEDNARFAVVRGMEENYVYVADPVLGNCRYSPREFEKLWNGVYLTIENEDNVRRVELSEFYYVPPAAPSFLETERSSETGLQWYPNPRHEF